MIPVTCRVAHKPDEGQRGDCLRACIASLLELDAEAVPHFHHDTDDGEVALGRVRDFLRPLGLGAAMIAFPGDVARDDLLDMLGSCFGDAHYLLFGQTDTGGDHVQVCRGNRMVHNPGWAGSGCIVESGSTGHWVVMGVVRL